MDTVSNMEKGEIFCQFRRFFKVYMPRSSSQRMKLPPGVGGRILENPIPRKLFLRNRCGKRFSVELGSRGNDLFLEGAGWVHFVRDNGLVENNILVFYFDGTDAFDVKIFEQNGCEKIDEGEEEEETPQVKVEVKVEETNDDEEAEDKDYDVEAEELEDKNDHEDATTLAAMQDVKEEKEEEEEEEEKEEEEKAEEEKLGKRKRRKGKGRKEKVDIYGTDLFKSGAYIQPVNPYFVTKVKQSRKHMVHIPDDVVKELRSLEYELPEKLKVRDPRGGSFTLKLNAWVDGRIWYKDGWRRLCQSNLIDVEDIIICEFIKKVEIEMRILIVRAGNRSSV